MPGKSTYFDTKYFTEEGVFDSSGLECTINNSDFRKGDSLRNFQIKDVLNICKKYHRLNVNTLIIKDAEILTIWIEKKFEGDNSKMKKHPENQSEQSQIETPANNIPLPTKTVTKRYRGQVYEETVIDWSAVQQSSQQNKPARKYRGQYID